MHIAILGAGNVGLALARGWTHAGHQITFGVSDPADPKNAEAGALGTLATTVDAAAAGEVIVLAVPYQAVEAVIARCGGLAGKRVIDATNPVIWSEKDGLSLSIGFTTSGGEEVARLAPHASIYKTMNQVGFGVMDFKAGGRASDYVAAPVMYVAGDDEAGKPAILGLVSDLGFEAIDAGPLKAARLLEPFAMLWIDQAANRGAPRDQAFAMLKRTPA